ncbi:MAG: PA14 domain-containing protein, partial [Thermoplasmata archaeon]
WKTMAEDIISAIRSVDPNSVIFVSGVDWGYSLVGAGSSPIAYDNIIYSTHPYPIKPTPWETYFGFLAASYPVFAGEWGFANDGTGEVWDADRRYAIQLLYYLEKKGIGWAAWILHPRYKPNLLEDWSYTPTESGHLIKDWLFESHLKDYLVGGLRAQYFHSTNLTNLSLERIDGVVNFDWGTGSPDTSLSNDSFSVRWVGRIRADFSEVYTFYTYTDEGVRLWVDGQFLIDKWFDQTASEWSASISLSAGLHSILFEYYEKLGNAVAQLSWSSPSLPKEIVPSSNLYHVVHPQTDTVPPEIHNTKAVPSMQELGLPVNISADVTDNVSVYEVLLNLSSPTGVSSNITMSYGQGNSFYLNRSYSEMGSYSFVIWASDSNGNWNSTAGSFSMAHLPARPPVLLDAFLSGPDHEDVVIVWALSPDDGRGAKSVHGYELRRNRTYVPGGAGYQSIALLPTGTTQFVDSLAGDGDPNAYFYVVCAINGTNSSSCSWNQAGKYARKLSKGLHLLSVPLIQSEKRTENVLQTLSFDRIWSYDSVSRKWEFYMKSRPFIGELESLNHTIGFWANVTEDSNLTVAGLVPLITTISLSAGWNLIGFPSLGSHTIGEMKLATGTLIVEGFGPRSPPYYLREMKDVESFSTGFGYWVLLESESSWTVSAS